MNATKYPYKQKWYNENLNNRIPSALTRGFSADNKKPVTDDIHTENMGDIFIPQLYITTFKKSNKGK